jgi:hypothetical protein
MQLDVSDPKYVAHASPNPAKPPKLTLNPAKAPRQPPQNDPNYDSAEDGYKLRATQAFPRTDVIVAYKVSTHLASPQLTSTHLNSPQLNSHHLTSSHISHLSPQLPPELTSTHLPPQLSPQIQLTSTPLNCHYLT